MLRYYDVLKLDEALDLSLYHACLGHKSQPAFWLDSHSNVHSDQRLCSYMGLCEGELAETMSYNQYTKQLTTTSAASVNS